MTMASGLTANRKIRARRVKSILPFVPRVDDFPRHVQGWHILDCQPKAAWAKLQIAQRCQIVR
jgi:hypothetical protein